MRPAPSRLLRATLIGGLPPLSRLAELGVRHLARQA